MRKLWIAPSKSMAGMIVLSLCLMAATSALADELQVSQSGTLTNGDTFAYSFDTDSNPTPTSYGVGYSFTAPITNFVLDINSVPTGEIFDSISWYEPVGGGGYGGSYLDIFSTENMFAPGTEADPTIIPGVYTSEIEYDTVAGVDVKTAGDITIQKITAPEPGAFSLVMVGLGSLGLVLVMRKRIARGLPQA
jgi:hypothetical protein